MWRAAVVNADTMIVTIVTTWNGACWMPLPNSYLVSTEIGNIGDTYNIATNTFTPNEPTGGNADPGGEDGSIL